MHSRKWMHGSGSCPRASYVGRYKRHLCSNPGIRSLYLSSVFFKDGKGTGVTMEMFHPKTQILNKSPKPRNIKETKSPSLPTENSTLPWHRKTKTILSTTERKVLQRRGPLLLPQARCLLFCKIKHLSATTEIKYVSKIFS